MSSPKPFTSLAELREWHLAQVAHYNGLAMMHTAFAATPVSEAVKVADAYRERAKHYEKMAQVHLSAAEVLNDWVLQC